MKYNHVVKANGVYYPAGSEIPENKGEEDFSLPFTDTEIKMETEPVKRGRPRKNS